MMKNDYELSGISMERLISLVRLSKHDSILAANGNDQVNANLMGRQIRELRDALGVNLTKKEGGRLHLMIRGQNLPVLFQTFLMQ